MFHVSVNRSTQGCTIIESYTPLPPKIGSLVIFDWTMIMGERVHPWSLRVRPWKMMLGRLSDFWDYPLFSDLKLPGSIYLEPNWPLFWGVTFHVFGDWPSVLSVKPSKVWIIWAPGAYIIVTNHSKSNIMNISMYPFICMKIETHIMILYYGYIDRCIYTVVHTQMYIHSSGYTDQYWYSYKLYNKLYNYKYTTIWMCILYMTCLRCSTFSWYKTILSIFPAL